MWLNGLGVAFVMAVAAEVIPFALSPYWLRLPMALFLAGIMLSGLGLLWSGLTRGSLVRQAISGRMGRTHWVPALFATISYALALVVFAAGCWAFMGVASLSQFYEGTHNGIEQQRPPRFQHPQAWQVDRDWDVVFR